MGCGGTGLIAGTAGPGRHHLDTDCPGCPDCQPQPERCPKCRAFNCVHRQPQPATFSNTGIKTTFACPDCASERDDAVENIAVARGEKAAAGEPERDVTKVAPPTTGTRSPRAANPTAAAPDANHDAGKRERFNVKELRAAIDDLPIMQIKPYSAHDKVTKVIVGAGFAADEIARLERERDEAREEVAEWVATAADVKEYGDNRTLRARVDALRKALGYYAALPYGDTARAALEAERGE